LAILLRFWRPREVWQFAHETAEAPATGAPRRVMGGAEADLPGRAARASATQLEALDSTGRIVRAFSMYIILVIVILIGQMGNLPWWAGHPVGDVKTSLATPVNVTADFKCGNVAFKLCPQPWIGPDPAKDRQAFKFPYWSFFWPGTYEVNSKGQPTSVVFNEPPIVKKQAAYNNPFNWDFLAAARTLVLIAGLVAFLVMTAFGRRVELIGRRDGQDDQPPEPVGRRGRCEPGGRGGRDLPAGDPLQPDPHHGGRRGGDDPGVRHPGNRPFAVTLQARPVV